MGHVYVLDTGALLTNWTLQNPELVLVTATSVVDEIENQPSRIRVENLKMSDRLREIAPEPSHLDQVRNSAEVTGDITVLSSTDIDIVALALGELERGNEVTVVSTDLAVLNTARYLKLGILDPSGKMKELIFWVFYCPACSRQQDKDPGDLGCPVCGTKMRRRSSKKRPA
ncbi:MAG: hypothetical protein RTU30_15600 [Candidatus Thorarchaeota archaeon]